MYYIMFYGYMEDGMTGEIVEAGHLFNWIQQKWNFTT